MGFPRISGKASPENDKEKNRVKAEGIASAYRTKLAEGRVGIIERKPAPTFSEGMKAFLDWSKVEHKEHPATYRRYKTSSKALLVFLKFKGKPIDEITPKLIEDFKEHRAGQSGKVTKRPIKPATINRELACPKAMYFHVLKDRHDFGNPVSAVEFLSENNNQNRVLTFQEQQKYLSAANENLKDVATLILETGMRPEEVYRIRVENVSCCGSRRGRRNTRFPSGSFELVMVMRYVHPGEAHRIEVVKKLAVFNANRQIAEFEKKAKSEAATVPENHAKFSEEKTEGKPNQIN